jgi:hypothetical protein
MHTMTVSEHKAERIDLKALAGNDREFLRQLIRTTLQEVLEAEMTEALVVADVQRGLRQPFVKSCPKLCGSGAMSISCATLWTTYHAKSMMIVCKSCAGFTPAAIWRGSAQRSGNLAGAVGGQISAAHRLGGGEP